MIQQDMARLRLFHNVAIKGHVFSSEDVSFLLEKQAELRAALEGVTETLEIIRGRAIIC